MQRWLKVAIPALALSLLLGTAASALATGGSSAAALAATGSAHGKGHPRGHGKEGWNTDQALHQIRQNPQEAADRLSRMLVRVQQRQQSVSQQIGAQSQKLNSIGNPAEREVAQAALAARQAELAQLQARATMLQKLLAYAQSQGAKSN